MPKINIKTDFTDGDNLYGQELNNNFNTIKAAFETTLEKVTTYTEDQIIAFDENGNLVDSGVSKSEVGTKTEINEKADKVASATNNNIATLDADGNLKDSGYNKETIKTWNDNSTDVKFFKGTSEQVDDQAITNGQLLYDTQTGETYLDAADIRIPTGGGTVIAVSTTQPTNPSTKLWINPDEDNATAASNVVDSMTGNEVDKSPSVHAVKNYVNDIQLEQVDYHNYIQFNSSYTIASCKAFRFLNIIYIIYDITGTFTAGQNVVGSVKVTTKETGWSAGRVTDSSYKPYPASVMAISNGDIRVHTNVAGSASAGEIKLFL